MTTNNLKNKRLTILPIKDHESWKLYKQHVSTFWIADEVDLTLDKKNFNKLSDDEKHFLKYVLAFFSSADSIVLENLAINMFKYFDSPEIRSFYGFQIAIENIHSEMYSLLIDNFITNEKEKRDIFNAVNTIPVIGKKANWCIKNIELAHKYLVINDILNMKPQDDDPKLYKDLYKLCNNNKLDNKIVEKQMAKLMLAFACVEGIFFSGSFCCIYWFKSSKDILPGLSISNDFIARDEGLHCNFACHLYNNMKYKLNKKEVYEIVDEAVKIEIEFIEEALPNKLLGMNKTLMTEYIKYVANRLLMQLNYEKYYKNVKNPFNFMERICLEKVTNFFEHRSSEYSKYTNLNNNNNETKLDFSNDLDLDLDSE